MIKKILLTSMLISSCALYAQEGSKFLTSSIGADFSQDNNYILELGLEKMRKKYNSHVFGVNAYKEGDKEEYLLFYNFKTAIIKAKNTIFHFGIDVNTGHNVGTFIFGPGVNFNLEKSVSPNFVLFVNQNSKALFSADNLFRHQVSFGIKIKL